MVIDLLAIIFGILFTIRKLETRRRESEQFPGVPVDVFERYKAQALRVYNVGAAACFGKLLLDYGFQYAAGRLGTPWSVVRVVGASIFFTWLGLMIWAWIAASRARRFAEENGINLRTPIPERSEPRPR
jgi:hypothetical protein